MAKSQRNQTYVLKLNSGYLAKHGWNLDLNLEDVRKDAQMVVALGSSQVLRWLTHIQGRDGDDIKASELKRNIRDLKHSAGDKTRIKNLYRQLYQIQFQQDYVMIVMDKVSDYRRALKGFTITVDGRTVKYRRLLGTTGSIKKSTIIFVNVDVHEELMKRINNGRDMSKEFVAAKLNAYCALTCSASIAVTWPRFIVINDTNVKFKDDVVVVELGEDEPIVKPEHDYEVELNACDGMGLITPEMSAKWSAELNEGDEPLSGFNCRSSFLKGMVFTLDFKKFAEEVAGTYIIKDAWGTERDVRDADALISVSMLKLWDSYSSYESYIENCRTNEYDFAIAKSTPHKLRDMHTTNYQYLQDYTMTDEQIDELIEPTVSRIKDISGLDWRKLLIYMCGDGLDEDSVKYADPMCKAIMANPQLVNDPYVRSRVQRMIQKRIRMAKIGVLDIEGDYAIVAGDPYSLLQQTFGMDVTGLLKAGQCYHQYWSDKGVNDIVMFRAPMTSHNNVCRMQVTSTDEMKKWYGYIKTCCIINSWDTTSARLNG